MIIINNKIISITTTLSCKRRLNASYSHCYGCIYTCTCVYSVLLWHVLLSETTKFKKMFVVHPCARYTTHKAPLPFSATNDS